MAYSGPHIFFNVLIKQVIISNVVIFYPKKNITKRIPVQTGGTKDSLIEVIGYLIEGDTILQKGSEEVKEGMKISIK